MTRHRSRRPLVVVAVVLVLLLLGGAAALVAVFLASDPDGDRPTAATSASTTISLSLEDRGTSVAVTWTDPSRGRAPFVVSYGRADGPANKTQGVGAGTTTVTVGELDPSQDYCFTVAGEPGSGVGPSPVVCTRRPGPAGSSSPRPSGT